MSALLFFLGVPLLFSVPVMQHAEGDPQGLVLAAPHDGYDMYSGDMARRVARKLGWATVVAKDYRDTQDERWINVNRPTECLWRAGQKGKETETERARVAFREYLRRLREASGVAEGPIPLLVEFHGHNRRVEIGTQRVRLDVIEVATRGFTDDELRALRRRYEELSAARWPVGPRILMRFDQLDETYVYQGKRIDFYYNATGAKRDGSLQSSVAKRVLHFEMPQNARSTKTQRQAFGELMSELLGPLAAHASAGSGARPGASGVIDGQPGGR